MDVKEAVRTAKSYVFDLFADDGVEHATLEEVEQDDATGEWRITLSMSRPGFVGVRGVLSDFKVVIVRPNGEVRAVKHRHFADG
jgi:hypothetical protein